MTNSPTRKPTTRLPAVERKRLSKLGLKIEKAHNAVLGHIRTTVEHAIKAGALLSEAKKIVPHGGWQEWLDKNTSLEARQAQRYMKVFDGREALPKTTSKSYLTLTEALELLDPEEEDEKEEEEALPYRIVTLLPETTLKGVAYREETIPFSPGHMTMRMVKAPLGAEERPDPINLSLVREEREAQRGLSTSDCSTYLLELIGAWNRASLEDRVAFQELVKWAGRWPIKLDEKSQN